MRRRAARGQGARGQGGETLLELLVTVSIMGTAFVGVLAGIGATFMATDSHRQEATAETVLRNYAERMKDPTGAPYVTCATTATYASPTGFSLPADERRAHDSGGRAVARRAR
jgi:Tfp pilus assembly protein PilV